MTPKAPATKAEARGYSLVEVSVVVLVIAIMSALLVPVYFYVSRARITVAKDSLRSLAKAMRQFHEDTGAWPQGSSTWNGATGSLVGPIAFSTSDTSLHAAPSGLSGCIRTSGPLATPCWGGPYVSFGASMADAQLLDPWGMPFEYALIPPGTVAPNGMIVVWSTGPDKTNQTSDPALIAKGQVTSGSDDIMQVVGSAL